MAQPHLFRFPSHPICLVHSPQFPRTWPGFFFSFIRSLPIDRRPPLRFLVPPALAPIPQYTNAPLLLFALGLSFPLGLVFSGGYRIPTPPAFSPGLL